MKKFAYICAILAVKNCFASGASVKSLAAQAKRHPRTIRRWIAL